MSNSAAMTTPIVTPEEVIEEYIQNPDNHPLRLKDFVTVKRDFIISNLTLGEDYRNRWSSIFFKMAKNNNMSVKKSKPNWSIINSAYVDRLFKEQEKPTRPTPSVPSSSYETLTSSPTTNTSCKISNKDCERFNDMFTKTLDAKKFWILSTGTVVELKMRELAMQCTHEHPCLSMILDPADCVWENYFTKEELIEIEEYNKPVIADLPPEMSAYLNNYKNLKTLPELWEENDKHRFDRVNQHDMHWIHSSVSQAIDILLYNIQKKYRTESDLMKRIWVMIDCCFDDGGIDASSGESVSETIVSRLNSDRSLAAVNPMLRQKVGTKADILFTTEFLEFGTCEAGKITDVSSTKTLYESGMKTPKTLKDMLFAMANVCPSRLRELKACGFVICGLNILPLLMDSPKGYVARVNRPSHFFNYPTSASNFLKSMRSILSVIHDAKMVMNNVNEIVNNTDESRVYGSHHATVLPPSFITMGNKRLPRKRKINDVDLIEEETTS